MFAGLRTEIEARFAALDSFFAYTKKLPAGNAAIAKGLVFVQVYAVYEYTVCNVVVAAIDQVNARNHRVRDLIPSLMALALDAELNAIKDCSEKKIWDTRIKLFEKAFSNSSMNVSVTTGPPHDGSHFRYSQLEVIFRVFGIKRMPVRRRSHIGRIREVVDHRNAIAHGKETAQDIGRRYTTAEIRHVSRQMKSVCLLLVDVFQKYGSNAALQRSR